MRQIILFDGICNLCNASVNFILDHDKKRKFQFASLQSDFAQILLSKTNNFKLYTPKGVIEVNEKIRKELNSLNSILYLKNDIFYIKSDAALQVAMELDGLIRFVAVTRFIPTFIRDIIYDWISRNRYRWFGKLESCRMPTPELKGRFLE